jgi:hypothetical protein
MPKVLHLSTSDRRIRLEAKALKDLLNDYSNHKSIAVSPSDESKQHVTGWIEKWCDVIHLHGDAFDVIKAFDLSIPADKTVLCQAYNPKDRVLDTAISITTPSSYFWESCQAHFLLPNMIPMKIEKRFRKKSRLRVAALFDDHGSRNYTRFLGGFDIAKTEHASDIIVKDLMQAVDIAIACNKGWTYGDSLRFAASGIPTVCFLSFRTGQMMKSLFSCKKLPFLVSSRDNFFSYLNLLKNNEVLEEHSKNTLLWFKENYDPEHLVMHYHKMYSALLV